jgi:HK97 family phage major capsid protein
MKTMTTNAFGDALAKAGRIKGAKGVEIQKKLLLENYMIVGEDGVAVDPETLDVVIKSAAPEVETDAMMSDEEKEKVAEIARDEVAKRFTAGASRLAVKAEVGNEWEKARVYGRLKNLKDKKSAYRFGTWCLAAMGHRKSAEWCKANGLILTKGHAEGINSQGGFLVPDEFENELITLREQYGVARRECRIFPMSSDTKRIPKRTATLTAYFVGEAAAGTESQQTFDAITLVAKKLMALTTISNELNEDNVVGLGDDVAGEIAYAFANKEDECLFNGDGTSTYGGVVGLAQSLTNTTYQISDASAAFASFTIASISAALAKLPAWSFQRENVKFYCSKSFYHQVLERLAMTAGGVTSAEVAAGLREPRFFGYPVVYSQVVSSVDEDGKAVCYVGDMAQAVYFGDRRQQAVSFSDSALNAFEQDEIAVRGTERFDIVCANVGGAAASGAMIKIIR